MQDGKKLFLIDGSSYIYRAFFALPHLSNSKGFPTNAVFGFTNMILKVLRERQPEYMAMVFDRPGPTFRHEAYEAYKAQRPSMPETLGPQIPYIKEIVAALGIPVLEEEGFEADDVIGTLTRQMEGKGIEVVIVSGDKDLMQLVDGQTTMYDPMKDKTFQVADVNEYFGVGPEKVVEVMGLCGDSSDNIPGIPGIGRKTASLLIRQFGTIEGVLENADRVKSPKVRENLKALGAQARMSRQLATLKTNAPIFRELENLKLREPDRPRLQNIFRELEFSKFIKEFAGPSRAREENYSCVMTKETLWDLAERLRKAGSFSLNLECTSAVAMRAHVVGFSFSYEPHVAFYIPVGHTYPGAPAQLELKEVLDVLRPLLEDPGLKKYGQNLKFDFIVLRRMGVGLRGVAADTMVASYLLNPAKHNHTLEDLAREYLDHEILTMAEIAGTGAKALSFDRIDMEKACRYACQDADFALLLADMLLPRIEDDGFGDLLRKVELPLTEVLAAMEMNGVRLDVSLLESMSREMEGKIETMTAEIHELAGEVFNINSPQQLGKILFEKLKYPGGKRTKTGYSTDVEVLTELSKDYPLPAKILECRTLTKLKSTYVDALVGLIHPETGRVHTSFNQTVTATGRLSSSDPNLQNIPIRDSAGRRIRQAFIPEEGALILSADYSQIELRILAHLSADPSLIETFRKGEDVHTATAAEIFNVSPDLVSSEMRRQAKVINFGIVYGMSPFGLSKELSIPPSVAQTYISEYFGKYRGVREYIERSLESARAQGYVATLMNRRRYLPDIRSGNRIVRQFAERIAVNAPIQGTAADLIKVAMIRIHRRLQEEGRRSRLILQIHDELVLEVPAGELEDMKTLVRQEMEGVCELSIPLVVDIGWGKNWAEAH